MKRKDPSDLRINYPASRAKPGQKAKARAVARASGQKTFLWHCPNHGMALFSTSGRANCRQCLAVAQRAAKQRKKAPAEAPRCTAPTVQLDTAAQARQDYPRVLKQRQEATNAAASKTINARDHTCTS